MRTSARCWLSAILYIFLPIARFLWQKSQKNEKKRKKERKKYITEAHSTKIEKKIEKKYLSILSIVIHIDTILNQY